MPKIILIKITLLVIALIGNLTFVNASGGPFYNGTKVKINVDSCDNLSYKQEIESGFKVISPRFMRIYGEYLKIKPGFSGKVILKFTIFPNDYIKDISLVSSTTDYPEFDNAIKDAVVKFSRRWRDTATSTVQLEFVEYVDPKMEKELEETEKELKEMWKKMGL